MSLNWNIVVGSDTRLRIQSQVSIVVLNSTSFNRPWRLTRLRRSACPVIRNDHQLSSSSYSSQGNLFNAFLSQLNSLDLLAPALGFTTALAILYNSTTRTTSHEIGDWTLFTSPTPFNRFVKLRCASLLLEDSNEKIVKEGGHLITVDTGRIQQAAVDDDVSGKQLSYQRICITTDDGGVVSLDWPANLELTKEHGLDTTILIVPGTTDGSMDENVRSFVYECLKRGCFPIVMNPRGCARSPLTTPRLFTAADSDDVCTSVQFINRARPSTTLMGVGLGFGANMLTKYLAEVGEETSLTAAMCLDNPFDIEEAARSPNHFYADQNLIDGLIDILQSNKELFQGQSKGFDVEKALQAKSLKDFEESISMVSHGFDSVEKFYANSNTTYVIGNVKIPLLFIQNNVVPSFSIPRSMIAENPFTSLLICTFRLDNRSCTGTSVTSWCQRLVLEWLMAIELGLLKGRHPLLEDTDVTINPSKRLKLMASRASSAISRSNNLQKLHQVDDLDSNSSHSLNKMLKRSDVYPYSSSGPYLQKPKAKDKLKEDTNGSVAQTNVVDTEVVKEENADLVDSERGQVVQATEVVMNMLDVRMPEALSEEQKQKVLTAVGQGETLMNALQLAVPEDVRGKLTGAVTAILQNQKKNINGLSSISSVADGLSALNTNMPVTMGISSLVKESNTLEHNKEDTSLAADSNNHPSKNDASSGAEESEAHTLGNSEKSDDSSNLQSSSHHGGDTNSASHDELGSDNQSAVFSKEKGSQSSHFHESDSNGMANDFSKAERSGGDEDRIREQVKPGDESQTKAQKDNQQKEEKDAQNSTDQKSMPIPTTDESSGSSKEKDAQLSHSDESDSSGMPNISSEEESSGSSEDQFSEQVKLGDEERKKEEKDNQQKEEKDAQGSTDQKSTATPTTDESSLTSPSSPEKQPLAKDGENQPKEESSAQPLPSNNSSKSPSFSVSQAFDALTGMDDSTQLAVNSVFSVIEGVITQLEEHRDEKSAVNDKNTATDSKSEKHNAESDSDLKQNNGTSNNRTTETNESSNHQQSISISNLSTEKQDKARVFDDDQDGIRQHSITKLPYMNSLYEHCVQSYVLSNKNNVRPPESDSADALILGYDSEEGQWKLLGQSGDDKNHIDGASTQEGIDLNVQSPLPSDVECNDDIIEPAHVILDPEGDWDPIVYANKKGETEELEIGDDASAELMQLVKEKISNSLKVEVCRRIQATDMMEIAPMLKREIEQVANTISLAVVRDNRHHIKSWDGDDFVGPGNLHTQHIIDDISSAVQGTKYMKEVVPVGIVVGRSLASLGKIYNDVVVDSIGSREVVRDQMSDSPKPYHLQADSMVTDEMSLDEVNWNNSYGEDDEYEEKDASSTLGRDTAMFGAVTAALGASALLVHQQDSSSDVLESSTASSMSFDEKENHHDLVKLEEQTSKSDHSNIGTSLAEKAMSVAGPVLPTKEDGELDQQRLVAMLADLGQRGGILRLVGKAALLWGGIRGAMSLTGKLISFLRLAERPLFQRILGFISLVLVMWTPVVVPLLPTLVQNWTTHNSSTFAEFACIIGLYSSIMLLVVLWGTRIRGYENPLERYGLHLTSTIQIRPLLYGFIGGVTLVTMIQLTNVLLGFVCFSWPTIPSSTDAWALVKFFGRLVVFVGQGLVTTLSVALVEELLFRAWLPEEIAADLGFNRAIILSGLAFSLSQWSLNAIPGLWLLSLGLAGVRQRFQGSLSVPIGLRAGIMASGYVLKEGGFLIYQPAYPLWVSGGDPFQPFNSVVGLAVALLWAAILYPKKPRNAEKLIGDKKYD